MPFSNLQMLQKPFSLPMDDLIDHCVYKKYMVSCSVHIEETNLVS